MQWFASKLLFKVYWNYNVGLCIGCDASVLFYRLLGIICVSSCHPLLAVIVCIWHYKSVETFLHFLLGHPSKENKSQHSLPLYPACNTVQHAACNRMKPAMTARFQAIGWHSFKVVLSASFRHDHGKRKENASDTWCQHLTVTVGGWDELGWVELSWVELSWVE
jgi:hypothetical protein